jgi:predicted nucleic acid-binding protein
VKTYVLDSHPLLVYFEREDGWETVADLLQQASEEKCHLVLSMINWGEVYYITLREYNEEHAEKVLHALSNMPIELKEVNKEVTMNAAKLKAKGGLSYADCFAAGLAMMIKNAEVVTGDKEFKQVEKNIKIHWIK